VPAAAVMKGRAMGSFVRGAVRVNDPPKVSAAGD